MHTYITRPFLFGIFLSPLVFLIGFFIFTGAVLAAVGASCSSNVDCSTGEYCMTTTSGAGTCQLVSPAQPTTPAGTSSGGGTGLFNPLKANSLEGLLADVLAFVARLGFIVVVVMIIWVGFMFVAAQGNSEKISKARTALLWTIIGGLILIGAQAIALLVQATASSL